MGNYDKSDKPKSVGSAYFNTKKGTDDETVARVRKGVEFFAENGVRLSVSLQNGTGGYDRFTAFFNGYKRSAKDPDLIIRVSEPAQDTRPAKQSAKSPAKTVQKAVVKNEIPF